MPLYDMAVLVRSRPDAKREGCVAEEEFRRAIPRMSVDWDGYCWVGEAPGRLWRRCRIVDLTPEGLGIEIDDALEGRDVAGERIQVCISLEGEIRHFRNAAGGGLRAGVKLEGRHGESSGVLAELNGLGLRW
jgi:hypothetical protein